MILEITVAAALFVLTANQFWNDHNHKFPPDPNAPRAERYVSKEDRVCLHRAANENLSGLEERLAHRCSLREQGGCIITQKNCYALEGFISTYRNCGVYQLALAEVAERRRRQPPKQQGGWAMD